MNICRSCLTLSPVLAFLIAGCSSQPVRVDELDAARSAVQRIEVSPDAGKYAAAEIAAAHQALRDADELASRHKARDDIQQAAYVAQRHADIAVEQIQRGRAQEQSAAAEDQRQKVLLQAREQEAAAARARAESEKQQAEIARQQAMAARQDAVSARQDAETQRQQAQMVAEAAQREAAGLAAQLRDLQARQTERGLVLTLGDVLFDTGEATLKPGAASTMDRLSAFLNSSPERSVIIEGHTDSLGTEAYNQALSESRANSVQAALVAKGVPAARIATVGKGESAPVASNSDATGRQQNRRVEIIISNPAPTTSAKAGSAAL